MCAARLRGPYLAGVTLAVALVVPAFTTRFAGLFNADQGLSVYVDPPPAALGPYFPPERWQAWIAIGAAMLSLLIVANLVQQPVRPGVQGGPGRRGGGQAVPASTWPAPRCSRSW